MKIGKPGFHASNFHHQPAQYSALKTRRFLFESGNDTKRVRSDALEKVAYFFERFFVGMPHTQSSLASVRPESSTRFMATE